MYWEICHDSMGSIIDSPYKRGFGQLNNSIENLLIYDLTNSLTDWQDHGLEWVYYRIEWCIENRLIISDFVYQDYIYLNESSEVKVWVKEKRRKRVYELRFKNEIDAAAFKLRWL